MKTSNKLLIGLLGFVVLVLIIVNVVFHYQVKHKSKTKQEITTSPPVNDSTKDATDSLDMENAISNE